MYDILLVCNRIQLHLVLASIQGSKMHTTHTTEHNGAEQLYCMRKTCSWFLYSKCLRRGSNPYYLCYRSALTNRPTLPQFHTCNKNMLVLLTSAHPCLSSAVLNMFWDLKFFVSQAQPLFYGF